MKFIRKYFLRILSRFLLFLFIISVVFSFDVEGIQGNFEIENCTALVNILMHSDNNAGDFSAGPKVRSVDVDGQWFFSLPVIPELQNPVLKIFLPHIPFMPKISKKIAIIDKPSLFEPPRS